MKPYAVITGIILIAVTTVFGQANVRVMLVSTSDDELTARFHDELVSQLNSINAFALVYGGPVQRALSQSGATVAGCLETPGCLQSASLIVRADYSLILALTRNNAITATVKIIRNDTSVALTNAAVTFNAESDIPVSAVNIARTIYQAIAVDAARRQASSSSATTTSSETDAQTIETTIRPLSQLGINLSYMSNRRHSVALMKTSMGDCYIELYADAAPQTAQTFIALATGKQQWINPADKRRNHKPFYDGQIFFNRISNTLVQSGDPLGTGLGNPGFYYSEEIDAVSLGLDNILVGEAPFLYGIYTEFALKMYRNITLKQFYEALGYRYRRRLASLHATRGTVAMVNPGPSKTSSQFIINLVTSPWEDGRYTVFGKVIYGLSIIEKISRVETTQTQSAPYIISMTIFSP